MSISRLWSCTRHLTDHYSSEDEALPTFHPEFGRFMLEATPGRPWGINLTDLLKVESNMRWRCDSDLKLVSRTIKLI